MTPTQPPPTGRVLIGVDTGGTYTDAVVLDAETRRVRASAKALTTRDDLSIGVAGALDRVMVGVDPGRVGLVSVSTTLATNAVVEGKGSPVLVILVGFNEAMFARTGIAEAFSDAVVVRVEGGHDHYGTEAAPLDVAAVERALDEHRDHVSAVAVASLFAVRNASHEEAVRDCVIERSDLPVTISSSLSDSLDAPRRALTTALNARLLSRISDLVAAVSESVGRLGIDAPMMVAKGDGSLVAADVVARRPIETVLSGPAASIVGAATLTGRRDFVLSDVGGTTTDVGQLRDGRPRLVADGARVGGWRTMVEAIDVRTSGLGGDSAVVVDRTRVALGPRRRVPLSLLATIDPSCLDALRSQRNDPPSRDSAGLFVLRANGENRARPIDRLTTLEQRLLERLDSVQARPVAEVAPGAVERRGLDRLVDAGMVSLAGFTPSDAAHVLGLQQNWSADAARAGAELLAWYGAESAEEFSQRVHDEMVRRSVGCVVEVLLDDDGVDPLTNPVLDAVAAGRSGVGSVEVSLRSSVPVVAVGGPAGVYYPEVATRCGAELELPESFAVANAVGAAAGEVVARGRAEVHSDGPGRFRVVTGEGSTPMSDGADAIDAAVAHARAVAQRALDERTVGLEHLGETTELLDVERHDAPDASGDDGLYGAVASVELRVRPVG